MLSMGSDYVPEKYTDYRNRTMTKHKDNLINTIRRIKECSLKGDDKKKLLVALSEILLAEMDDIILQEKKK